MFQISLALILVSVVLGFTFVKNANYALAEKRATSTAASLDSGRPQMAMESIDSAIALAPDVGRYHVTRANILDQTRKSTAASSDRDRLALEVYQANSRAVLANQFDLYGRLNFAESALTLAVMGQPGRDEETIEEYRRLTSMQPRFWLSHFLLGRAYAELGELRPAIEAYSEAIKLDPLSPPPYDRRAEAYGLLGEHGLAADDYATAIKLSPGTQAQYLRRGVALFALGRLEEAIRDFDQAIELYGLRIADLVKPPKIQAQENLDQAAKKLSEVAKLNPHLAMAHNNRGSAYYQLGLIDIAIGDYNRAVQLSPRTAEFYANRAFAYELLNKDTEAKRDFDMAIELGFDIDPLKPY